MKLSTPLSIAQGQSFDAKINIISSIINKHFKIIQHNKYLLSYQSLDFEIATIDSLISTLDFFINLDDKIWLNMYEYIFAKIGISLFILTFSNNLSFLEKYKISIEELTKRLSSFMNSAIPQNILLPHVYKYAFNALIYITTGKNVEINNIFDQNKIEYCINICKTRNPLYNEEHNILKIKEMNLTWLLFYLHLSDDTKFEKLIKADSKVGVEYMLLIISEPILQNKKCIVIFQLYRILNHINFPFYWSLNSKYIYNEFLYNIVKDKLNPETIKNNNLLYFLVSYYTNKQEIGDICIVIKYYLFNTDSFNSLLSFLNIESEEKLMEEYLEKFLDNNQISTPQYVNFLNLLKCSDQLNAIKVLNHLCKKSNTFFSHRHIDELIHNKSNMVANILDIILQISFENKSFYIVEFQSLINNFSMSYDISYILELFDSDGYSNYIKYKNIKDLNLSVLDIEKTYKNIFVHKLVKFFSFFTKMESVLSNNREKHKKLYFYTLILLLKINDSKSIKKSFKIEKDKIEWIDKYIMENPLLLNHNYLNFLIRKPKNVFYLQALFNKIKEKNNKTLNIDAKNLLQSSMVAVMNLKPYATCWYNIKFAKNESEGDGLLKTWFSLLAKELTSEHNHLFNCCDYKNMLYQPNIFNGFSFKLKAAKSFEFVGMIIGLSLRSGFLFPLPFPTFIYEILLGNSIKKSDLIFPGSYLHNKIEQIEAFYSDNTKKGADLSIYFTLPGIGFQTSFSGTIKKNLENIEIEMCRNGKKMLVTKKNYKTYTKLLLDITYTEIKRAAQKMRNGLLKIICNDIIINIKDANRFKLHLCGEMKIDINDWKENTIYYDCDENNRTIKWFWRFLKNLNEKKQRQFLEIVTGSSNAPAGGFASFEPRFSIKLLVNEDHKTFNMIFAQTCFNLLILHEYKSYTDFKYSIESKINKLNLFVFDAK
ncbi:E3 ubiquitin-protein ligase SMURF2 [Astathelohania contejeani]|uniref:HECT-type E3 ubiquitin transferase n=1 Tax=Astathelohania contejeani TaxID=164912 RepID=A0ABQ7HYK5_9MICR|nr:E3 ubiquitin-protein ligase SMURF2 [Thelohania contejeani]